ncbi:GDSL-type esterase/lipase family protein [Pedobacter sp. GR22-6]|uniref:GDSL-type esterase/lipase family protein n=1 Tax=Pedobacter sp. GR22-6 TaxID=3127957 RepID=UPI00307D3D2C
MMIDSYLVCTMTTNTISFLSLSIIFVLCCAFARSEKGQLNIVFIGDSITQANGIGENNRPPTAAASYLMTALGWKNVQFNNQGRSGFTTVDFLPATKKAFPDVLKAADSFSNKPGSLVFSIMLGTNDSAIKGPNGSPVSKENYRANLKAIGDSLLLRYPDSRIVFQGPLWYSDSTRNSSSYLVEGRERLQSYLPQILSLVKAYKKTHPERVFFGDRSGYGYFKKNHLTDMKTETGPNGRFYLHPNDKGAEALGILWAKAIAKVIRQGN